MNARLLAARAHPTRSVSICLCTVDANWCLESIVAFATIVTVRITWTVCDVATDASPTFIACACCQRRVAIAMPGTVRTVPRATWNFAQIAAPPRNRVAHALVVAVNTTVARAFRIAAFAGPTLVALALARIHWVLLPIDARLVATNAHPA